MTTMDIEKQVDAELERKRLAQDEEARAVLRAQLVEKERIAWEVKEQSRIAAARAAYLARAEAAHGQACAAYKSATDVFREARIRLQALDTVLSRSGFSGHQLGIDLRHSIAAPDEADITGDDLRAAVDAARKTLGG
jgi:hypothetical protein